MNGTGNIYATYWVHQSLVLVLLGVFFFAGGCGNGDKDERFRDYSMFNPGGDFTLVDQSKNAFHLKDHRGETVLLFFGYISCPDVCPTTLSKLSRVYSLWEINGKKF
ncbi:MAG: SCO family protein [Candidatus Omnitrophica bacterium]|nr:SCO family protein [Candidatus Omnitrophota bacterium]